MESERLEVLHAYRVLNTPPEERFDRLTRLAADLLDAPTSLITLIGETQNWFKSHHGFEAQEGPRKWSFCEHLLEAGPDAALIVPDAALDPRFADNPFVTGAPYVRFYAGLPVVVPGGHVLGTLCVIDSRPRPLPTDREMGILRTIAAMATDELELGRRIHENEERERLLDLATTLTGIGSWRYDAATDRMIWSDEAYAIHGVQRGAFDPNEGLGLDFLLPEDKLSARFLFARAKAQGEDYAFQHRIRRPDGALRQVACKAACRKDETGKVMAILGILQDITDHLQAAQRIADTETKFRLLAENSCEMVAFVARDGTRTYVSPASRQVFGMEPEDLLRDSFLHLVHPEDYAELHKLRDDLLDGTVTSRTVTFRAHIPGRGKVWVETSLQGLRDPRTGAPDGFISVSRDISDRKAVLDALIASEERLRLNADLQRLAQDLTAARDLAVRSNEAKSRFLTSISHELRTPLNGILGYAQLLRHAGKLTKVQTAWVETMLGAGEHLLAMINNVLDLAEIETQHVELRPEPSHLHGLLRMCVDLLRPAAEKKRLELTAQFAATTPSDVMVDVTRLRQILLNLLSNAVKYTDSGSVALRACTVGQGATLRFEISDTGPGIMAERRSRLFKDFERLGTGSASAVEGTGLGLAISAKLAAIMGGRVGHADNPGGGSVFWLELPCVPVLPASDTETRNRFIAPPATVRSIRVLVVDDVAANREIAAAFLHAGGHRVCCAAGGEEALRMAASQDFDVVLMDVRMPEMDGLEATRRLRALPGGAARIPVIALTAQSFTAEITACQQAGMGFHLAKPYTLHELLEVIEQAASGPAPPVQEEAQQKPTLHGQAKEDSAAVEAADLPICDTAIFNRTAAYLTPEAVDSHMRSLATRSEEILAMLHLPAGIRAQAKDLAAAAHNLAGSAGMFGFRRLSLSARRFEEMLEKDRPEQGATSEGFAATLETTLHDMRRRLTPPEKV